MLLTLANMSNDWRDDAGGTGLYLSDPCGIALGLAVVAVTVGLVWWRMKG